MSSRRYLLALVLVLSVAAFAGANPVPPPSDTNMPVEDMYAQLVEIDGGTGLEEIFSGFYWFDRIDDVVHMIEYPLPPANRYFGVHMGKLPETWEYGKETFASLHAMLPELMPLDWTVLRKLYPTILPEWPWIPVNGWWGPDYGGFPKKAMFVVKYKHDVLRRGGSYVYFYALGSGKEFAADPAADLTVPPFYRTGVQSFLDITMPRHLNVTRMSLDYTPHPFAVTTEGDKTVVSFYAESRVGPFTKDLIAHIRPWWVAADVNYDDKTDVIDMINVRNQLGKTASDPATEAADVNGDGQVNILDLIALRNHLGERAEADANCPPQIRLRYKVKACSPSVPPPPMRTDVTVMGNRMLVTDLIWFNCCPEYIRMAILIEGNRVIFREKGMTSKPCKCMCYFPMSGVAGPFASGTYYVEIVNPYGETILKKEVVIP